MQLQAVGLFLVVRAVGSTWHAPDDFDNSERDSQADCIFHRLLWNRQQG